MSLYDLGVTPEEAKKDESFKVAPAGTYSFQVEAVEKKETSKGRPMHVFRLSIVDDPDNVGVSIFHNCVLPWTDPSTGSLVSSGIGRLSGMVRACGMSWEGTKYDPEGLIGSRGQFVIVKKPKNEQVTDPATGQMAYVPIANPDPSDNADWTNDVKKFLTP